MNARPKTLIAIAGTGTEVGKTWFAAKFLLFARKQGIRTAARKPAQSFASDDAKSTDAELLAQASGESAVQVCPQHRWYPRAMAPPMAAEALNMPPLLVADLLAELAWPASTDIGLVETAGGLYSPIAHDADNVQLLGALQPDHVFLVADAGLGTINAIRLCLPALKQFNVDVFLNRFDSNNSLHQSNRQWLRKYYGIETAISIAASWDALSTKSF
jgi:dethiobiotin synthetase